MKALNEKSKREEIDQYLMMTRYMFLESDRHADFGDELVTPSCNIEINLLVQFPDNDQGK